MQTWVRGWRRHPEQLLTYLDWLAPALASYEKDLAQTFQDSEDSALATPQAGTNFMRLVARCRRLGQALDCGHTHLRFRVQQAEQALQFLLTDGPTLCPCAQRLTEILDAACRASSLVECLNGLLKQFLHTRGAFRNSATLQIYPNLFTLWHNMRIFQGGKRQGMSPYQRAGIQTASDDWLTLLGYPAS